MIYFSLASLSLVIRHCMQSASNGCIWMTQTNDNTRTKIVYAPNYAMLKQENKSRGREILKTYMKKYYVEMGKDESNVGRAGIMAERCSATRSCSSIVHERLCWYPSYASGKLEMEGQGGGMG